MGTHAGFRVILHHHIVGDNDGGRIETTYCHGHFLARPSRRSFSPRASIRVKRKKGVFVGNDTRVLDALTVRLGPVWDLGNAKFAIGRSRMLWGSWRRLFSGDQALVVRVELPGLSSDLPTLKGMLDVVTETLDQLVDLGLAFPPEGDPATTPPSP